MIRSGRWTVPSPRQTKHLRNLSMMLFDRVRTEWQSGTTWYIAVPYAKDSTYNLTLGLGGWRPVAPRPPWLRKVRNSLVVIAGASSTSREAVALPASTTQPEAAEVNVSRRCCWVRSHQLLLCKTLTARCFGGHKLHY